MPKAIKRDLIITVNFSKSKAEHVPMQFKLDLNKNEDYKRFPSKIIQNFIAEVEREVYHYFLDT